MNWLYLVHLKFLTHELRPPWGDKLNLLLKRAMQFQKVYWVASGCIQLFKFTARNWKTWGRRVLVLGSGGIITPRLRYQGVIPFLCAWVMVFLIDHLSPRGGNSFSLFLGATGHNLPINLTMPTTMNSRVSMCHFYVFIVLSCIWDSLTWRTYSIWDWADFKLCI